MAHTMRSIIIILLLCLPVSAKIGGHVELGKDLYSNMSYTDIRIDYTFTFWNLKFIPYGNQITWFYQDKFEGFPFRDVYIIGSELNYSNVIFGAEHFCSHFVSSGKQIRYRPDEPPLVYNFTKVFIKYKF